MIKHQQWFVSIYMSTHRTGTEAQQDPIRLKNLLKEAEHQLFARGVSTRDTQRMLEPANNLVKNYDFWQRQSDGLVIFISFTGIRYYRLPLNFEELVAVEDHFYIQSLIPLFTGDGQFFILALSKNHIRLLNGTRYSVSEVDIGQLVGGLEDAFPSDDHQVNLQLHTSGSTGVGSGGKSATFHGHGAGNESDKDDLLRYFRFVDDALFEFLQGDEIPLVLAGVEYFLPIYKEVNTYPNLIDSVIKGNPDLLSMEELHRSAWDILRPFFQAEQEKAVSLYQQLAGQTSELAADTLEEIVPAAYNGRVEILFIAAGKQQWGVFNTATNKIELHDQKESGDEHLLDLAAVQTFLKGGTVYVVEPEKVPGGTLTAAVLRF